MRKLTAFLLAFAIALPGIARAGDGETSWQKVQDAFASSIEKGHKSTVSLDIKAKWKPAPKTDNPMAPGGASNPNYNERPRGVSSGVLIDDEGHILTSNFNVDGKIERITVIFADGQKAGGRLLGRDESKDLALIKVDPKGLQLTPIEWAEEQPQVGSFVMALGRAPEPERGTATKGIVSAWDRIDQLYNQIWEHSIQFDAKANYGNSGGPLVDLRGRMVGVVGHVRLISPWGQNSGIAFATPNYKIKEVLERLKGGEVITKPRLPFLGVGPSETTPDGVVLGTIQPGTAAEAAGLKPGDVVNKIDDVKVANWEQFVGYIKKRKVGDKVLITLKRGEKTMTVEATLGERPN